MKFPLSTSDISLWLAVMAIILLLTSELLSAGPLRNVVLEKEHLRLAAIGLGLGFMATVVMRAFQLI
jgi:hypothetical protein